MNEVLTKLKKEFSASTVLDFDCYMSVAKKKRSHDEALINLKKERASASIVPD